LREIQREGRFPEIIALTIAMIETLRTVPDHSADYLLESTAYKFFETGKNLKLFSRQVTLRDFKMSSELMQSYLERRVSEAVAVSSSSSRRRRRENNRKVANRMEAGATGAASSHDRLPEDKYTNDKNDDDTADKVDIEVENEVEVEAQVRSLGRVVAAASVSAGTLTAVSTALAGMLVEMGE
jgi:hypothetical protein